MIYIFSKFYLNIIDYDDFHDDFLPPKTNIKLHNNLVTGVDYLDALIATKMMKVPESGTNKSVWQCLDCGKEYKLKGDASRHVEAHHIDHPGFSCEMCGKVLKTRDSLRNHIHQLHRQTYQK